MNLTQDPLEQDPSIFARQSSSIVYNNVVIPDLEDAIAGLDNSNVGSEASSLAAKALLGKVYMYMNDYTNAATYLKQVIDEASAAGVTLESDYASVVLQDNSEIIFAVLRSSTIADEYSSSEYIDWYGGTEDKALLPLDSDLADAYDAAGDTVRKALVIDDTTTVNAGVKWNAEGVESDLSLIHI